MIKIFFNLDAAVAPVGHNDVPIGVDGHARGCVELTVSFTVRAEFEQELPVRVVYLKRNAQCDHTVEQKATKKIK